MTTKILMALLLLSSACAAIPKTAMVECTTSDCASPEADPITTELNRRASADLQCPVGQLQSKEVGQFPSLQAGPWELSGCGRSTVYRNAHGLIERTSPVVASLSPQ